MPSPIRRSARGLPLGASSTTSSLSSRQDRSTRANNPQKSGTPRSLSSEEASEPPVARRSQRQPAQKDDGSVKDPDPVEDNDEEAGDEEEITRCICGHQEYPGPPLSEAFADLPDAQAEDAGGLFILCDGCTVWQHGGCVGIVEESQSPDKYFCEECQPKKHAVAMDSRGQKYSLYLPLHPKAHRKSSMSKSEKEAKKERDAAAARASVDPSTGKRRATMRSKEHDDEEEQLKRAIEESKREVDGVPTGRRIGKRGRDDSSEDSKQDTKRQRRASESMFLIAPTASIEDDSDDENTPASRSKKAKAEAALVARQAEQKEKDQERDKARAEAAGRRQERARSRRNDESEAADDSTPRPTNTSSGNSPPPPSSQPPTPPPAEKAPIRRGPGKKPPKKLGNNQYTKRRFEEAASSPHGRKKQLNGSGSGDDASEMAVNGDITNGTSKQSPGAQAIPENGTGPGKGKFGRGKKAALTNGNGVRAPGEEVEKTFTNMHSALVNMSTYIARQQDEIVTTGVGGEKSPVSSTGAVLMMVGGVVQPTSASAVSDSSTEKRFEELSCADMAMELQKGIVEWQRQWGHLAAA